MAEYLESLIQQRIEILFSCSALLDETTDEWLKEYEKLCKMLVRARRTNNYAPLNKYIATPRHKEIFGSNGEDIIEKGSSTCVVNLKKEKISSTCVPSVQSVSDDDNMPPPKMPPPMKKRVKKEKVSTAKKVEQETEMEKKVTRSTVDRTSDVILEEPVVQVIELDDSSEKLDEVSLRSTRTKTMRKERTDSIRSTRTKSKKASDVSARENETSRSTRTKTRAKKDSSNSAAEKKTVDAEESNSNSSAVQEVPANTSSQTVYEDAMSQLTHETFTVQKNVGITNMNTTIIIGRNNKPIETGMNNHNDLLTDDESVEEKVHNSEEKIQQVPNEEFSPFKNSPVKKKVEAFEKLQKNEITTSSKKNTSRILKEIESNKGNLKEKGKVFIENSSSSVDKSYTPGSSKICKYMGLEFKNRELKRQEKEKEMNSKEISKRTPLEEKKKKYEEKISRVQQYQKKVQEKEKEKALELQKIKEERYKMVRQQKEEKQRQLKQENERRALLAKQRAEEKRKEMKALEMVDKKDHDRRIESEQKNANSIPIYMTHPTPPIPCDDRYDSDDERSNTKRLIPSWATKSKHQRQDHLQNNLGHRIKNTLFFCKSQDIDLRAVFQKIDPKKLKRTSSAYWKEPPRFTILPSDSNL